MNYGLDTSFLIAAELAEHPGHAPARSELARIVQDGDRVSIAPQVLAEFIHVATDGRRFEKPLTSEEARQRAVRWWMALEVDHVFPTEQSSARFLAWLQEYSLGRKRLLDTMLAATYYQAGIRALLTLNARDFTAFGCFHCLGPSSSA